LKSLPTSIEHNNNLPEIVYLICLEARITVKEEVDYTYPIFHVEGLKVVVDWPERSQPTH